MSGSLTVRRADLSDLESLAELFDMYRQFYEQVSHLEAARLFLRERLIRGESVIFTSEHQDRPVGFAQLYPSFSSVSMQRLWILNDLFVHPDHRGQGAARSLLHACCEFARESGAKGLSLRTAKDNSAAQKLYEASGWKLDSKFLTYSFYFPTK